MKLKLLLSVISPGIAVTLATSRLPGQSAPPSGGGYRLDWLTLDTGGGACTGGGFTLPGTIGQHDAAAPANGGAYTLEPGFWSAVIHQPEFPALHMSRSGSAVTLWWEAGVPFVLQQSSDMLTWRDAPESVSVAGPTNTVVQEPGANVLRRFYRLRRS